MKDLVVAAYRNKGKFRLDGVLHTHPGDYELLQIWGGNGRIVVGEHVLSMSQGGLYLINASNLHFAMPEFYEGYERNAIRMHEEIVERIFSVLPKTQNPLVNSVLYAPLSLEDAEKADAVFRTVSDLSRSGSTEGDLLILSHLSYLCSLLMKCETRAEDTSADSSVSERVISYVRENYKDRFSLSKVARELAISKYYLCHTFRAHTGITVLEYVNSYRLAKAKALLISSELSVTEIAFSVGFCTYSYFSAFFKRCEGRSPREFRKAYKNKGEV
ncbi:MAG: helix-turn-helix transcriptional regulator [Clostridia bacterium]|nr:helix-turn-helix transcriptional regulator [Clostridia bacterium]